MTRQDKRRWFAGLLAELFRGDSHSPSNKTRTIRVEPLESRQLLASDGFTALLGSSNVQQIPSSELFGGAELAGEGELVAEGEDANDLVAFAKALADSGTRFFGAAWCPFCTAQKELFEDGADFLPFIEVTNPDRSPNQIALDEGITQYPTWEFPDGTRLTGQQTLETISQRAEVPIPQSSTPSFVDINDVSVAIGSPLHIPVDAYDPNGDPLTITVTSSDPSLLTAEVLNNNRSIRISTAGFGDMVFELFEGRAPVPAGRVIQLANDGFYDNVTFHRVINNFVIQGGDPTGTGSGGSTLGDFDDQFNLELQHNRTGVLSYAKSSDDTNDSQFFITEGPQRFLDFNHSVFGQLVEGEKVRDGISNTATNSSDRPTTDVVIETISVFNDTENGVIMLKPTGAGTGPVTVTVTVTDSQGNSTAQTFTANVVQDTANGAPFLNPIADVQTSTNTPVTINLTSQDAEDDTRIYSVQPLGSTTYGLSVDSATGVVTVTPPNGFSGELQFRATVRQSTTPTTSSPDDNQVVRVLVTQSIPTGIDLLATSDSGASDSDDITNAETLVFSVSGTTVGAEVQIHAGDSVVGTAIATGATTEVTVANASALGEGAVLFTASQIISGAASGETNGLSVRLDRSAPVNVPSGTFPASTIVDTAMFVDLANAEEGQGLVYSLVNAPAGMTIGSSNGQVNWTPGTTQFGANVFTLVMTDLAGNISSQDITINVIEQPAVQMRLQTVDLTGNPITTVSAGENFKVRVIVEDLRDGAARTGVFAAYTDLMFDQNVIEPIANSPIAHPEPYTNDPSGDVAAGLINELGGFSSTTSRLGADARILAEVTFVAKASGDAMLRLESADDPGNDVLVYDQTEIVPLTQVDFGSSPFAVGVNFELNDDDFSFDEDSGQHTLDVLQNDTVTGGAVLTISDVTSPSGGGTVAVSQDGLTLLYTPAANFNGAEVFTYTAANQEGVDLTATVTVQVTDVNDPPVALNDTFSVFQNSTNNVLEVLGNDNSGVDQNSNETLTITSVGTGSAGGAITIGSSGLTLRYTPATGFQGTETFVYTVSDGRGGTAVGSVSVAVAIENPPPTPQDDSFTVVEDAAQASFDVLANDTTSDEGETLSVSAVGTSTAGSQVSVATDGQSILYRPAANFAGTDVVTYTLQDSNGGTATGTVTFTVTAVNDAPDAIDDVLTALSKQSTTTLSVLANDTNVDAGEILTITAVTQPPSGSGTLAISADSKSLVYTPPSDSFEGTFAVTYTISDGNGLSDTATLNLTVSSFTPRSFSGTVLYAAADGGTGLGSTFSGIKLKLTGTDQTGAAVSEEATVGSNGSFSFNSMAPGDYLLTRDPLPFLNDSGASVPISSGVNDGDFTTQLFVTGSLRAQFIDVRDFLGSSLRNSLTAVLNADGTSNWLATRGDWSNLSALDVGLNGTTSTVNINGVNASQSSVTASIPLSSARVSHLQDSGVSLLRVRGSTTSNGLTAATNTAASGEGELVAEGEGVASPIVANQNLPSARPVVGGGALSSSVTPSSAIRQLLGSSSRERLASSSLTVMSAGAVDSAMEEAMPELQLQLSSELESVLTSKGQDYLAASDSILAGL